MLATEMEITGTDELDLWPDTGLTLERIFIAPTLPESMQKWDVLLCDHRQPVYSGIMHFRPCQRHSSSLIS